MCEFWILLPHCTRQANYFSSRASSCPRCSTPHRRHEGHHARPRGRQALRPAGGRVFRRASPINCPSTRRETAERWVPVPSSILAGEQKVQRCQEPALYRRYADQCRRLAKTMSEKEHREREAGRLRLRVEDQRCGTRCARRGVTSANDAAIGRQTVRMCRTHGKSSSPSGDSARQRRGASRRTAWLLDLRGDKTAIIGQ